MKLLLLLPLSILIIYFLPNVYGHTLVGLTSIDYSNRDDCVYYDEVYDMIITCGGELDINELALLLNNSTLLYEESDNVWVLNALLSVGKGTTLKLLKDDVTWLKIIDDDMRKIHIQVLGNLFVDGVKITSWDPILNDYSRLKQVTDYRPHIFTIDGNIKIRNSFIGYLGYDAGRSHGLSFYEDKEHEVINSTLTNNYMGIYTDNVGSMIISNNKVFDNYSYGIDPHTYSKNIIITNNTVYNNGNHGIICSRFCENIYIANNTVFNNREHGIMLDRNTTNSIIRDNIVKDNGGVGIMLFASSNNTVINNTVINHEKGIRISDFSYNNYITNNYIETATDGIYIIDDNYNNIISNNRIADVENGILVKNSYKLTNQISNNTIIGTTAIALDGGNLVLSNNSYSCDECFLVKKPRHGTNIITHINDNLYNMNYFITNGSIVVIDESNYLYSSNLLTDQYISNHTRLTIDKDGEFILNKEDIIILPNSTITVVYDKDNKIIHINSDEPTSIEIKGIKQDYRIENSLYKEERSDGTFFVINGISRVYLDSPTPSISKETTPSISKEDSPQQSILDNIQSLIGGLIGGRLDVFYSVYTILGILLTISILSLILVIKKR